MTTSSVAYDRNITKWNGVCSFGIILQGAILHIFFARVVSQNFTSVNKSEEIPIMKYIVFIFLYLQNVISVFNFIKLYCISTTAFQIL